MSSVARLLVYRLGLKTGLNPVRRLQAVIPVGQFFRADSETTCKWAYCGEWRDGIKYFGWSRAPLGNKFPDWHVNSFNGVRSDHATKPWSEIPDFNPELGDIKTVWEASRWDWVLHFALDAKAGDCKAIDRLNAWLTDWLSSNPPYYGVNWKCGQEASIRVMHLAMASVIQDQAKNPFPSLLELVRLHLQRIAPTIQYAIAQNNNHGTSEAAALFIGGTWLEKMGGDRSARKWASMGRKWLENRIGKLVETDGSFSQYSVNYHRVMLDTLSMAEVWRRCLELPPFSKNFIGRARSAVNWLAAFVDTETGDTPNMGANDGARLLPISQTDHRDCRPAVQMASVLFSGKTIYPSGPWNEPLQSLGIAIPSREVPRTEQSCVFDKGGYAILQKGAARVYLRYPRFRFRPSHADALHVDLWLGSRNLLRDSGSFSYADDRWSGYFSGTASHNTIQFDGRDQMPRLGRFLFGEWLRSRNVGPLEDTDDRTRFAAAYRDWLGAQHERQVNLSTGRLLVMDRVEGFNSSAVLRWRLAPGEWRLDGNTLSSSGLRLQVTANVEIKRIVLVNGKESRYYHRLDSIPVLEVEITTSGEIVTTVEWGERIQ